MKNEDLNRLYDNEILSPLDVHFARFVSKLAGNGTLVPDVSLAAALVSSCTRQGHICLDLSGVAGTQLLDGENGDPVVCPELSDWQKTLGKSPVVGTPGEYKPLILDSRSRLYLYRYWDYQEKLFREVVEVKLENRKLLEGQQKATTNYLLFCEHPHVYTLGKSGNEENLQAYWKLNEGNGEIVIDSSMNIADGQVVNCNWVQGYVLVPTSFDNDILKLPGKILINICVAIASTIAIKIIFLILSIKSPLLYKKCAINYSTLLSY